MSMTSRSRFTLSSAWEITGENSRSVISTLASPCSRMKARVGVEAAR
jgi:hypothetical protein